MGFTSNKPNYQWLDLVAVNKVIKESQGIQKSILEFLTQNIKYGNEKMFSQIKEMMSFMVETISKFVTTSSQQMQTPQVIPKLNF